MHGFGYHQPASSDARLFTKGTMRSMHLFIAAILLTGAAVCGQGRVIDVTAAEINTALENAQPGDVFRVPGGTHKLTATIKLSAHGTEQKPIRIEPASSERPVLDFSAQPFGGASRGIEIRGDWWQIVGLEIVGAGDNGINITGHHNVVERCIVRECRDTGIQMSQPASHNLIIGCDSFRNVDAPNRGENADGFAAKFDVGEGNVFRYCRAWENSDDGWDLWKAPYPVRIEDCVAFRNGLNLWNIQSFTGDGNGFKLGGDHVPAEHVVLRCVAVDQPLRGFDQNNNTAALTVEDCTAIRCRGGFYFPAAPKTGQHVLRRNLSLDAPPRIAEGTIEDGNRWIQSAPTTQPAPASQP